MTPIARTTSTPRGAAMADVAGGVTTPSTFSLTLTAREGTIPLTIRNDSGVPVQVLIRLRSQKLEFPDGDTIELELVEESTRIDIRVRSRATGAFPLLIDVRTPDGQRSLSTSRYTVRSTAVSGAGLVLSVGAGVFLTVWWARHWRRTRRSKKLVAAERPTPPTQPSTRPGGWAADRSPPRRADARACPYGSSPTAAATSPRRRWRSTASRWCRCPSASATTSTRTAASSAWTTSTRSSPSRPCSRRRRRRRPASSRPRSAASSRRAPTRSCASTSAPSCRPRCSRPRTRPRRSQGELDVRVVDSRSITAGLGTQVMLAAEAAASGASVDDVVALVDDLAARTHVFGALDTLDNLKKGGRIGGAQALVGSLLSIKPILDISSGKVEEAGKARTRKKALEVLRDKVAGAGAIEHLTVHHGFAPDVEDMLDLLDPIVPRQQIRVGVIGPVIGTHGGPRVMGVTWVAAPLSCAAPQRGAKVEALASAGRVDLHSLPGQPFDGLGGQPGGGAVAGRPLPPGRPRRVRRHGAGVARHRRGLAPPGGREAAPPAPGRRRELRRAVPAGGGGGRSAGAPGHRRDLRHLLGSRHRGDRDGAGARADAAPAHRRPHADRPVAGGRAGGAGGRGARCRPPGRPRAP